MVIQKFFLKNNFENFFNFHNDEKLISHHLTDPFFIPMHTYHNVLRMRHPHSDIRHSLQHRYHYKPSDFESYGPTKIICINFRKKLFPNINHVPGMLIHSRATKTQELFDQRSLIFLNTNRVCRFSKIEYLRKILAQISTLISELLHRLQMYG